MIEAFLYQFDNRGFRNLISVWDSIINPQKRSIKLSAGHVQTKSCCDTRPQLRSSQIFEESAMIGCLQGSLQSIRQRALDGELYFYSRVF